MEDFKRPSHPDFLTTDELVKNKWSGMRMNSITGTFEIWLLGGIVKTVSLSDLDNNPHAVQDAIAETFLLPAVLPDTPVAREYGMARDKIANSMKDTIVVTTKHKTVQ